MATTELSAGVKSGRRLLHYFMRCLLSFKAATPMERHGIYVIHLAAMSLRQAKGEKKFGSLPPQTQMQRLSTACLGLLLHYL
jgi:hypothetical protein